MLERLDHVGGAAVSAKVFSGLDARVSRYAYLVSLLPDQIIRELGLRVRYASRRVSSYSPVRGGKGLYVGRAASEQERTAASFRDLTGSDRERQRWQKFYARVAAVAQRLAPTLLEPLRSRDELRVIAGDDETWNDLIEVPIAAVIEREFANDLVRGVVLTDGLIGTSADSASLDANRCLLYHVIGNGDGEWKVPLGGMGSIAGELERVARAAGVKIRTGVRVVSIESDGSHAEVSFNERDGNEIVIGADHVLVNAAPRELRRLRAVASTQLDQVEGCQIKINMVLTCLPHLRSGIDPVDAFAGTFHLHEEYTRLNEAFTEASSGVVPTVVPGELYCHSLTDPSILGPELQAKGYQTLTLFGLQLPARLFDADNAGVTQTVVDRLIAGLDAHLDEPLAGCLAIDDAGRPCIEAHSPLDLDDELGLPRGNIFHRPLTWPFAETDNEHGRWGVETDDANVWLCGAGARRGGGVSGIPGRNAAMAVLEKYIPGGPRFC